MALVPEKIEIALTDKSIEVLESFSDSVEKFCLAAEKLALALNSRPTPLAPDTASAVMVGESS